MMIYTLGTARIATFIDYNIKINENYAEYYSIWTDGYLCSQIVPFVNIKVTYL